MKIALCSSFFPFINGGARNIVEWLQAMLTEQGHQVERIYLPEVDAPDLLFQQMMAYRWVDLEMADRIICFRPQAHLIPHPHKILWFIHHIRAFYDLWDGPYRGFPDDPKHRDIRDALHRVDDAGLREAKAIFTNSQVVSERLKFYNKIESEVLYPPVFQSERYHCAGFNDEIVCVCRLEHHKRQHLLVEAMRHTRTHRASSRTPPGRQRVAAARRQDPASRHPRRWSMRRATRGNRVPAGSRSPARTGRTARASPRSGRVRGRGISSPGVAVLRVGRARRRPRPS